MNTQKLPIGIDHFEKLRKEDFYGIGDQSDIFFYESALDRVKIYQSGCTPMETDPCTTIYSHTKLIN